MSGSQISPSAMAKGGFLRGRSGERIRLVGLLDLWDLGRIARREPCLNPDSEATRLIEVSSHVQHRYYYYGVRVNNIELQNSCGG